MMTSQNDALPLSNGFGSGPLVGGQPLTDLTAEEQEIIARVQAEKDEKRRQLYEQEVDEQKQKEEKKRQAVLWLKEWESQKEKEKQNIRLTNQQEADAKNSHQQEQKKNSNPWDRVFDNIEINQNQYVGTKDVSRMRQAMIARRQDVTKKGGLDK